ncbi:MAG: hypothetical protein ABH879_02740 [archaeon]
MTTRMELLEEKELLLDGLTGDVSLLDAFDHAKAKLRAQEPQIRNPDLAKKIYLGR